MADDLLPRCAFWLMPEESDAVVLQEMMRDLSQEFKAPMFEPHITLHVTQLGEDERVEQILGISLPDTPQMIVEIEKTACSPEFTKTLYFQLRHSDELQRYAERIRGACSMPSDYSFHPHLSLMYKSLPEEKLQQLAAELHFIRQEIVFNCIKAVAIPTPVRAEDDVALWYELSSSRFNS